MRIQEAMDMVYKSKVDIWLVAVIVAVTIGPMIPVMVGGDVWMPLVVSGAVLLLALYFICSISYVIEASTLTVRCGVFHSGRYDIGKVHKIERTRSAISAPAASLDRIAVYFKGDSWPLVVSPRDRAGFVKRLTEINPEIEYVA